MKSFELLDRAVSVAQAVLGGIVFAIDLPRADDGRDHANFCEAVWP